MSIIRLMRLTAGALGTLLVLALSDPAFARRDVTVDQCISAGSTTSCVHDVPSPGNARSSNGPGGSDDSSDDDSGPDDSDSTDDDSGPDDTTEDNAPE
ncbi:MAG: hypothetical protein WD044_01035 [Dongiaceae bacterium]